MDLVIGKKYLTDVAICKDMNTGRRVIIPILPLRHKDATFGVDKYHYHLDCRFTMAKSVLGGFEVTKFTTVVPLWDTFTHTDTRFRYKIIEITKHLLTYVNRTTGFDMGYMRKPAWNAANKVGKYMKWYETMIGKKCEGKKCPHYGTDMIDDGKHLVCPMHNLVADRKTMEIISLPK